MILLNKSTLISSSEISIQLKCSCKLIYRQHPLISWYNQELPSIISNHFHFMFSPCFFKFKIKIKKCFFILKTQKTNILRKFKTKKMVFKNYKSIFFQKTEIINDIKQLLKSLISYKLKEFIKHSKQPKNATRTILFFLRTEQEER